MSDGLRHLNDGVEFDAPGCTGHGENHSRVLPPGDAAGKPAAPRCERGRIRWKSRRRGRELAFAEAHCLHEQMRSDRSLLT